VRISIGYRALGIMVDNEITWFWIGGHDEYERLIGQRLRFAVSVAIAGSVAVPVSVADSVAGFVPVTGAGQPRVHVPYQHRKENFDRGAGGAGIHL
jgi:hypothetical protein